MTRADPHRALRRALAKHYPGLAIDAGTTTPWASATFTGALHTLACSGDPDLGGIEDVEFSLPGHIVADITARREGVGCVIDALTIEID